LINFIVGRFQPDAFRVKSSPVTNQFPLSSIVELGLAELGLVELGSLS
jgi:hypothetical protein